ncbi:MAG: WXG100 family type VII secretion target [Chloroflexota bacterium]
MTTKTLRVSPQELRSIAASLRQSCAHAEQQKNTLERAWARMDAGWEGYAETDITYSYNQTANEQIRTISMLSQMAQALEAVASMIEAADQKCQALFASFTDTEWHGAPGSPGDMDGLPPRQDGGGLLPPLPEDLQPLLAELLALLASLPPGATMDDLLTLLDGQPIAIAFQLYLGASGAFNPGAVAVSGAVYVVYNFQTHELSFVLGDEAALGVAGGAGADVGGGGGVMFFYGIQSNDAFNGGCTNFTATLEGTVGAGAEAHVNVTVMNNPGTGTPIVGLGFAGGPTAGAGGDVSATISVPGMNNAVVVWTIEGVDLDSFGDIPAIVGDSFIGEVTDVAQQAAILPLIMAVTTGAYVWSGVENVIDLGGDVLSFFLSSPVSTSPFLPAPVPTPAESSATPQQTQTPVPTTPSSSNSASTQDAATEATTTPEAAPTPQQTPALTDTPTPTPTSVP